MAEWALSTKYLNIILYSNAIFEELSRNVKPTYLVETCSKIQK